MTEEIVLSLKEEEDTGTIAEKENLNDGVHDTLLKQGAEARIYLSTYEGKLAIKKQRFSKKYRHPKLDVMLNEKRMKNEAKCMKKAQELGVLVPTVFKIDTETKTIVMEYIENSCTAKDFILKHVGYLENGQEKINKLAENLGLTIALLHRNDVVHGDLTTSNFLVVNEDPDKLYTIDFGLSCVSNNPENMAVDLYVLERALISTHGDHESIFEKIIAKYKEGMYFMADRILFKLEEVRARGRKRSMVG